ncbi:MAG TPA: efflux RND transporter permease subunit [Bellilinea sp.]|nr:efflux RND transporter permease subunit [Bellilinea sp.]
MGKNFFDSITRLSIRFKWITIAITVVLLGLGVYSALDLKVELLPDIDVPSTFVIARSNGNTDGNLMLQAYTAPMENEVANNEDFTNIESTTTTGFVFVQFFNEFGLDQEQIRTELQAALDAIELPVRTLTPSEGMTPGEMIEALTPDVVLYLYAYGEQENVGFLPLLNNDVWLRFSPEVLGALPATVFEGLDPRLATELQAKSVGTPQALPDLSTSAPPVLPESWRMDRFETAADLVELAGVRNLADIFNDFLSDGYVTGPLGTISDLTLGDMALVLDIEERCREFASTQADGEENASSSCSMLAYLDGEAMAALLTHFDAGIDGKLGEGVELPEGYLAQFKQNEQNQIATVLMAQSLSGEDVVRDAPLPDEWRLNAPELIAFGLDDLPLGVISISANEGQLSQAALRHLVELEVVPELEALGVVADVTVTGGETIRPDLLIEALDEEGLDSSFVQVAENTAADETASEASGPDSETEQATVSGEDSGSGTLNIEEGPPLPANWTLFAATMPEIEEMDTADDLLGIPGASPSFILNMAITTPLASTLLSDLTPEALYFWAEYEDGFFDLLSYETLQALSPETLEALPQDVQTRAAAPPLGEFWQRLATEPEMQNTPLTNAADLAAFGSGAADMLNRIALETPDTMSFFAIQLIDDLSPDVIEYLVSEDTAFLDNLDSQVYCYFSPDVLKLSDVAEVITNLEEAPCDLAGIASGEVPSAAQSLQTDNGNSEERIHDPAAPPLPGSWSGVTGFVGADELDTADDLFFTTGNGDYRLPSALLEEFASPRGAAYLQALTPDVLLYVANCEQGELCEESFFTHLSPAVWRYISEETVGALPEDVQALRETALLGSYTPQRAVTRANGNNSLILTIYKTSGANTVSAWGDVERKLDTLEEENSGINLSVVFEQASFIEESISGVAREGGLGAIMAVLIILVFLYFSVRSTLVTAISIPTSVAIAFVIMRWIPPAMHDALFPLSEDATGLTKDLLTFALRLFPESVTLNIMTLSGLTVAIGRVVDDAIVVLENVYRNIQKGEDQLQAVLYGTRDVSVAIFTATVTTVVVFLPIGLFGGIIGEFFLPFGLAVTYALLASFIVAITLVPLFAFLFIKKEMLPEEKESRMERGYRHVIRWALANRWAVIAVATVAFIVGVMILTNLPSAFLPSFGEPTITVTVNLPGEIGGTPTSIAVTDAKVRRLEQFVLGLDGVKTVQTTVGDDGQSSFFGAATVNENAAIITISAESPNDQDHLTQAIRNEAGLIFNDLDRDGTPDEGQTNVTVSASSVAAQGFGGLSILVSGDSENPPTLNDLKQYDALIIDALESVDGVTNVSSSLSLVTNSGGDVSQTYIRVNGVPAVQYTAELETEDTLGVTNQALEEVRSLALPDNLTVGQGFISELQSDGFRQMFSAMGIAVLIVYLVMALAFGSLIHPVTILFSLPVAIVGAAVALAVTGRVLGLSSMVGLLMLVGIVVTNAIVLIDRVQTNRKENGMDATTALINGGATRLRPILMTAIATMFALLPLAIGLSEGAIIAAELGTVVIGGLFSSTLLTLIVVPVVYSLFNQGQTAIERSIFKRNRSSISAD